jgi:hypothetical protein
LARGERGPQHYDRPKKGKSMFGVHVEQLTQLKDKSEIAGRPYETSDTLRPAQR